MPVFARLITPEMHYDDWARQYDSDIAGWGYHAPRRLASRVSDFLRFHPAAPRLLDVGIGTGVLAAQCRRIRSDLEVAGVDISARMLEICARRGVAGKLCRADIGRDRLPFADGAFDIAAAAGLMENVEDADHALAEMARVVRPGGLIAFTYMPALRDPRCERLAMKLRPGRTHDGRLVVGDLPLYRHSPQAVTSILGNAGAAVIFSERFVGYRTFVLMTVRYELVVARKAAD